MIEQRRPATRPDTEWLIRQIRLFFAGKFFPYLQMTLILETALAEHILGNWLCIEDAKVMRLVKALEAVYKDIDLQNVAGGSDELNLMVQAALKAEKKHDAETRNVRLS